MCHVAKAFGRVTDKCILHRNQENDIFTPSYLSNGYTEIAYFSAKIPWGGTSSIPKLS